LDLNITDLKLGLHDVLVQAMNQWCFTKHGCL